MTAPGAGRPDPEVSTVTNTNRHRKVAHGPRQPHRLNVCVPLKFLLDFPGGSVDKDPAANAGDMGLIPARGEFHILWSS